MTKEGNCDYMSVLPSCPNYARVVASIQLTTLRILLGEINPGAGTIADSQGSHYSAAQGIAGGFGGTWAGRSADTGAGGAENDGNRAATKG